jgi:cytochrome P450
VDDLLERLMGGQDDPWPLYDRLRETGAGVHYLSGFGNRGAYLCFRHADVVRVYADPDTFSSAAAARPEAAGRALDRFADVWWRQATYRDGPGHQRLRRAMKTAFSGPVADTLRASVEHVADDVIARLFLRGRAEIEFMCEVAAEVPVAVAARVIGVGAADRDRFTAWARSLLGALDPDTCAAAGPHARAAAADAGGELVEYLRRLMRARRAEPRADLVSALAHSPEFAGGPDHDAEVLAQLVLMLTAGNDTTATLLGNAVHLLLELPEVRGRLAERPSGVEAAVEEVLRFAPPVHLTARVAVRDAELGGHAVAAGTPVIQVIPAANRDPRAYTDPGTFRVDRFDGSAPAHLSFAPGRHHCLGDHLARLETRVLLSRFLAHFPALTRGSMPALPRTASARVRGWETLPVRLRP